MCKPLLESQKGSSGVKSTLTSKPTKFGKLAKSC